MASIDLTHEMQLSIKMLANKPDGFEAQFDAGGPVLTGASATLIITKDTFSQTLTIGNGITITGADKFALSLPGLPRGIYDYNFEMIPVSGEIFRINDEIEVV